MTRSTRSIAAIVRICPSRRPRPRLLRMRRRRPRRTTCSRALFPLQQGTLDARYQTSLAAIPETPAGSKAGGIAAGEAAAQR